jgi:hypothetical protein
MSVKVEKMPFKRFKRHQPPLQGNAKFRFFLVTLGIASFRILSYKYCMTTTIQITDYPRENFIHGPEKSESTKHFLEEIL